MAPLTFTTKEVSSASGLPMRQVQTFADEGVLRADEGKAKPGRGGSRQFPQSELEVASLLSAVAHKGMAVAEARDIAAVLRQIIQTPSELGFDGLDQATKVHRLLLAKDMMAQPPEQVVANPHQFMRCAGIVSELGPRWGHVEPTESNLKNTEAWIAVELARQGKADPIFFLYRGPSGSFHYEIWTAIPLNDSGGRTYRVGNAEIMVGHLNVNGELDIGDSHLSFDALLVQLSHCQTHHEKDGCGGYVIMPRRIFENAVSEAK